MSDTQAHIQTDIRGHFEDQVHCFSRRVRGTFALYVRPTREGGEKRCVRLEALDLSSKDKITVEVDWSDLPALMAVLRGRRERFDKEIKRRGAVPKRASLTASKDHGHPFGLNLVQGELSLSVPVTAGQGWAVQLLVVRLAQMLWPDLAQGVLLATLDRAPLGEVAS